MSPNNGILLNVVLRHRLLNIPFASCSFRNLDFSLPHIANFDNSIVILLLVFKTLWLLSVMFLSLNNKITLF